MSLDNILITLYFLSTLSTRNVSLQSEILICFIRNIHKSLNQGRFWIVHGTLKCIRNSKLFILSTPLCRYWIIHGNIYLFVFFLSCLWRSFCGRLLFSGRQLDDRVCQNKPFSSPKIIPSMKNLANKQRNRWLAAH